MRTMVEERRVHLTRDLRGFEAEKPRSSALLPNPPLVVCAVWKAPVSGTTFADRGAKAATLR